ncbi:hypothetical protein BmR1_04g07660 [Babesia microti strain RI]|uniref:Uncharacterized protein n=1 Tax=Babesia microti (strain RI) TaxID=1133968 RepID=I7JDC8_BABMR|nr:hypothetical protein BmR1_04g07660 [Babesia microti strain RI]CCF75720.1 hypothetical protein BmR1_04g07660 [Babesia microti strain RI]|eukprot:XP_012650128.1 hypothetical protein BmR1_04g07660 [Babesia microti strain RI]
MKAVRNNRGLYFVCTFIFIYINSIAFDIQSKDASSSGEFQESDEYEINDNECVASVSSQNLESNRFHLSESSDGNIFLGSKVCLDGVDPDITTSDNSDFCLPKKSEFNIRKNKLRSNINVETQTVVGDNAETLNPKEDKNTQTCTGHIKDLNLAILKEPFEFDSSDEFREDGLLCEQDDEYDHCPNNIWNASFNKIADYMYKLNACETISLNEPNGEIFLTDFEKYDIVKKPIEYVDLSKYNISNDELNRIQIPSNNINFVICDLNSLDTSNFNSQLKRTLSDFYGWVVIRPAINNGENIIGAVIFGNVGIAINENIKSRIVSFTIHERQQIIKIEEFTCKSISRVIYFEQSKETIGNKYFSMRKYHPLTIDNWNQINSCISFYTRDGITYHTLDFNSPKKYHNIFDVKIKGNETTYLPNCLKNIHISNVIFGNVKVLYEADNIYRSVRVIYNGVIYFIEIFTIDSLGRKNHLLYKRKDSIKFDNVFTKVKYSRDGSIIYHELETLKEAYLAPVNLNIPNMIYKGEMWDAGKVINVCICKQNYINDTILAENLMFCGKCCGCKVDIDSVSHSDEDMNKSSFIQFSYKIYKQFGSIYISLNPKLIYTHRLGKIKIGNVVFPLGSLGFVVSIKISKYNDNKVIIKFILLDGGRYNYIDYMIQPDGESLGLVTKYNVCDIKPKWLSVWDPSKSKILIDLYLDKSTYGFIKSEYGYEKDEIYYYEHDFILISNVYWKHKLLSDPTVKDRKLIKRNVRVVYISNARLVTIYSLYLTRTPQKYSKRIIFDTSTKYKYWNIDQQHFLQNSNYTFERISDEYASCKLRENEILRGVLYADIDENSGGFEDIFEIIENPGSVYYKIKSEISPDVKIGNVKIGKMIIKQSGIHDIIGIWIQNKMTSPYKYKTKCSNRKISIFINDSFKVMVIEYAEIRKDNGDVEYINLGPFPHINDNITDVISYALGKYLRQIKSLPIENKRELVASEMEYECLLLVKLEITKKYKNLTGQLENTTLYKLISEFSELISKEFIHEITNLDENEFKNAETMRYIYNAEVNIRNKKVLSLTNI